MKQNNIFKILLASAFIMALATSCTDKVTVENENQNGQGGNGSRTVKLGLQIEPQTKVTLSDAGKFAWEIGDKIGVWVGPDASVGAFQEFEVTEEGSDKVISGDIDDAKDRYNFAVYPNTVNPLYSSTDGLTITLPSSYTLAEVTGTKTPLPMVAINDKDVNSLTFYNICGLLRLTVNDIPNDATGLVIQFPGNKVNGTFTVSNPSSIPSPPDEPGPKITTTNTPGTGENQITVTFAAGTANGKTLNIPLPTGVYDDVFITPIGSSSKVAVFRNIKEGAFSVAGSYTVARAHGKILTTAMVSGFDLSTTSFSNENFNNSDKNYAYIYQSNSGTATSNTVTIADGQKVLLDGLNIKATNINAIVCEGDAEIVLSGTNAVQSQSQSGGTLDYAVIKAGTYESTKSTLYISGDGILNASPYYPSGATNPNHNGAVIGADYEGSCGNIVINSGTITVSTNYGAAIGSGRVSTGTSKCGSITINGGTISATSSTGAGIGSGGRVSGKSGTTSCDGITINGGKVTARSVGGAAIGAGKCEGGGTNSNSYCGNILITGGTIDAQTTNTGDFAGAAIGGGYHSKAGDITISGGNIKAVGSRNSAGIGAGGRQGQCGNILINGGSVDAQGGYGNNYEGAGIGTGKGYANNAKSTCGTITITNGVTIVKAKNVTAVATNSTAKKSIGKGSISYTQCGTVTINGQTGEIDGNVQYVYQPGAGS